MNCRPALLLVIAIVMPAAARAQMTSAPGVVIEEAAVRIDPTARVPLTTLSRGTDVTVLSVQESWVQIAFEDLRYGRRVGYIPRSQIKIAGTGAAPTVRETSRNTSEPARALPGAAPAARPPVRSVAAEFPSATPSPDTPTELRPATRAVIPIGDAFSSAVVPPTRGVRPPVSPKRGMQVTLMIPRALLKADEDGGSRTVPAVGADIVGAGRGAAVNGVTEWGRAGLPSMLAGTIKKISRKGDYTALELQTTSPRGSDMLVTLRFADSVSDPEGTLGQLVVEGGPDTPAAMTYRKEAHAAVADAIFVGDLGSLPQERKLAILATLQGAAGAPDVHLRDGRVYASFDLGVDARVFDERSADEANILAYVLNGTLLPDVRKMAQALASVQELHGMRVVYRIPHQPAPRAAVKDYQLELIADMKQAVALAGGEVTNAAFVDGATLLVDGQAVRVDLGH